MNNKETVNLCARYFILVLLGAFNLGLFYIVFTPLTVYPVVWILGFVDSTTKLFEGDVIFFGGEWIEIVEACVAGAAYYFLLILNLTTPMNIKKRAISIGFLFVSFLLVNIIRIVVFANLFVSGKNYFDAAHVLTWYFGSTVLVVVLWFVNVLLFKIWSVPVYSDIKNLFEDALKK